MRFCKNIFLFVLFGFLILKAQSEPYLIKNITFQSGGSQNTVHSIVQDKKGYLWFCTTNGLSRYDGYFFNAYLKSPDDSSTISSNSVICIYEDKQNILWIGTIDGILNKYDRRTGVFTHYDLRLSDKYNIIPEPRATSFPVPFSRNSDNTITAIKEDKDGYLWIGTWGTGIIRFDKSTGKFSRFIENAGNKFRFRVSSNNVKSIYIDSENNIWIGSILDGLKKVYYNSQKNEVSFVRYSLMDGKYKQVTSLIEDKDHNLLIGTFDGGLFKLPDEKKNLNHGSIILNSILDDIKKMPPQASKKIVALLADSKGLIWIGTYGGLFKYDPSRNDLIKIENLLGKGENKSPNVLSLCEDKGGIIWVGFNLGGGICKIEHNRIKFGLINKQYPFKKSLNDETVWSLYLDKKDVLWAGTENGGLNKFDRQRKNFSYYTMASDRKGAISDNCVRAITEDKWGDLWLGTYNGGLNHFNESTGIFTSFKFDSTVRSSISHNQVQCIYIDSSNTFWVGTFGGGLNKFKLKGKYSGEKISFESYRYNKKDPFSISSDRVYTIYEDRKKNLWIGTYGGGLNKFDRKTGRFIAYKTIPGDESSIEDNNILAIHEDPNGNLWIATYGGGLNKFDPKTEKFTRFYTQSMSVVYSVVEDENNNLWMSTDKGIFKYNYLTNKFTQYHPDDGIQNPEFCGGAYFKSKKGEIFLGGVSGINYFFPNKIIDVQDIPPIVVTNISVFNQSIRAEKDTIELSYSENFISFEFSALDYTSPMDHHYAYMLEGFNDRWTSTDPNRRTANYINLSPGTYKFRVKGTNSEDVWNEQGAVVTLIIKPLFWQTTWFRALGIFMFIGVLYFFFTLRYRGLLEIEKLKTKIAADLHDNVGAGLTEISILSELSSNTVKSGLQVSIKNLDTISEKARGLVDSMSDIVWVVNPKRDSLYDLIVRLKDSYSDTFSAMGIAFKTNNLEEFSSIKLPMDYKQNLYLIFKEALNNSIKHSKCKQITLDASIEKFKIELIMRDDGIGFNHNEKMRGNGIANIKNRCKQIHGHLEIESGQNGTIIKFSGRIKRKEKFSFFFK